jgi:hypothetical protein
LLARQGQKRLFTSHFLLLHCGEDGVAVRGDLAFVGRYRAPPAMEGPSSSMERGRRMGSPWLAAYLFPPHPFPLPPPLGNPSRRHGVAADVLLKRVLNRRGLRRSTSTGESSATMEEGSCAGWLPLARRYALLACLSIIVALSPLTSLSQQPATMEQQQPATMEQRLRT